MLNIGAKLDETKNIAVIGTVESDIEMIMA